MARRGGFERFVMSMAREVARQQRAAATAQRRAASTALAEERRHIREAEANRRHHNKTLRETERDQKRRYLEHMETEASYLTKQASNRVEDLQSILVRTLDVDDSVNFDSLRVPYEERHFRIPASLQHETPQPEAARYHKALRSPSWLAKQIPGAMRRFMAAYDNEQRRFETDLQDWQSKENLRLAAIEARRAEHASEIQAAKRKTEIRDAEVDAFRDQYYAGDPDALIAYNTMVLERSVYPEGFPHHFSIAYTCASKLLVIEYELPTVDVVPKSSEFRYVRTRDIIDEKARKPSEIRAIYQDVIASVALRTMHEVFEADQADRIEAVCFNGFIHSVDLATGRDTQPHLVSVRATKKDFTCINLAKVERPACLRNLGAQVSRSASEAQPVRPIVEFDMADARFIDQTDVVSGLANAPNLMELTPSEFEHLVANLFKQMGLDSKLTRSHRDGGVDCIAFDQRPILGGKVVIQAKRHRNTVGVSAVRDLYGTMLNEGANKGILVTTSGYGPDAFNFAADKPIELVDGGGLLFLLQETGSQARIIFSEPSSVP